MAYRCRLEPVGVFIDVEGTDGTDCVNKARAALEAAGFKPAKDIDEALWAPGWIIRDERAIHGTDSGSPTNIPY